MRKVALYNLLKGYWQLAEKLDRGMLNTYAAAVEDVSPEAVALACKRIASGQAGLNTSFPPTPADIGERARLLDAASKPEPRLLNGLIDMDFGHGRVDMRGLTAPEQDAIIKLGGRTEDGRNFALMNLADKRAVLAGKSLPAPPNATVPKMRSM